MNHIKNLKGPGFMLIGVLCLTVGEAVLKLLTTNYSPFQILFIRSVFALPLLFLLWKRQNSVADLFQINVKDQLIRTSILACALLLSIYSLSLISLFQYSSLFFTNPFFIVIFSIFLLKENVSMSLWVCLIIGFLGVVLIFGSSEQMSFEIGSLLALLAAVFYGLGMVLTCKLSRVSSPLLLTFWYTGTCFVIGLFGSFMFTFSFNYQDIPLFILAALLNISANMAISRSFQLADASHLAPLEYFAIPISAVLGYLIWTNVPETKVILGSLLIFSSSLYIGLKKKKKVLALENF